MMKYGTAFLSGLLFAGCTPGFKDALSNPPDVEGAAPRVAEKRDRPFPTDRGTVFAADFDGRAVNTVTGDTGMVVNGDFPAALFGSGLRLDATAGSKAICRFRTTRPLSLSQGSLEALFLTMESPGGFSHILDKSWQYGISDYDGKLAVHFGGGWWYSLVPVPLGKWTYVAVTFDGDTLKLYLNGNLAESIPYDGGSESSAYDLGIGNASDPGFDIPFTGIIDALRLSNCPRSPEEITKTWSGIRKKIRL